jgi:kynurenine formamidase
MSKEHWGRWGDSDERGALNLIGPKEVCGAATLVTSGRVVNLAQAIPGDIPAPPHRAPPQHFMGRDGGDYAAGAKRPGGFQFSEDTMVMPLHSGTHLDGLCHVWYDDQLYNGHPGDSIRSTTGATRCGIDKVPPIATRGLLLDIVALKGGALADGTAVTLADVRAACTRAKVQPRAGDAVLIRTGWLETRTESNCDFNAEPGLDVEAGRWLAQQGAALIGADNFAIEVLPFPQGAVFPVHQSLIRDYGLYLLEGLVLAELAGLERAEFMFVAAPLRIRGGTASPLTPMAIL